MRFAADGRTEVRVAAPVLVVGERRQRQVHRPGSTGAVGALETGDRGAEREDPQPQ